jgi:hypothetical protein
MYTVWGFEILFHKIFEENWKKILVEIIIIGCTFFDVTHLITCIIDLFNRDRIE